MLVAAAGDGDANAMPASVAANLAAAVAFVADDAPWAQSGSSASGAFDRTLLHERLEHGGFMPLTRSQSDGHQLALAFCTQMDFGAEAAPAAP